MSILDFAETATAECTIPPFPLTFKPDFTRGQFGRDERVHLESRCNRCGFRIAAADSDSFDTEEQEHASACRGSITE